MPVLFAFGVKPGEVRRMTPRDIWLCCKGVEKRIEYDKQMLLAQMRVTRWVGSLIYNSNCKKGSQKQPHQLLELDGDRQEKQPLVTKKQFLLAAKKWDQADARNR